MNVSVRPATAVRGPSAVASSRKKEAVSSTASTSRGTVATPGGVLHDRLIDSDEGRAVQRHDTEEDKRACCCIIS